MKKKGFTLIELLGVIVVLALIALIATPTILGVIDKARKGSLKNSAYGIIEAATLYYAQYGVSETEKFDLSRDNKLSYKGKVESGTVLLNSKGKIMICVNDGKNAAYKNYNDNEVVVVSGKTCNVNSSETQVLLDGEKTINEYTNQELTDLVNSLQEQIQIQQQEITSLKQQVNNKTDNSSVATLTTKHNEDINIINNKIGTEDLTVISDGSISQILIDNNELVKNLQTALSSKVDQTVTNNLSSQLSSLSGTVNNHTTQISNLTTSLNGKANSSHTHDDRYYTESEVASLLNGKANSSHTHDDRYYTRAETMSMVQSIDVPIAATYEPDGYSQLLSYISKRTGNMYYINASINIKKTAAANTSIIYSPLSSISGFVNIVNTYYPDAANNYNGYISGNHIYCNEDLPPAYYTITVLAVTNMFNS